MFIFIKKEAIYLLFYEYNSFKYILINHFIDYKCISWII